MKPRDAFLSPTGPRKAAPSRDTVGKTLMNRKSEGIPPRLAVGVSEGIQDWGTFLQSRISCISPREVFNFADSLDGNVD
ncbi:MAG: hypothetical protein AMK69_00210 [Nitrospira bacterium SG8_3]|nr:MAG: hypothetical protein AMK69_00210 [Nitrospira bacterium SG8_3]